MKHLYLLRHAKSDWDIPAMKDFDRPLSARGEHEAPLIGREMQKLGIHPDTILCSSALRTRQTIDEVINAAKITNLPHFSDGLYGASSNDLLTIVKGISDISKSAMICGHNPGLEELLGRLTGNYHSMTTACLASIDLRCGHWENADGNIGSLEWIVSGKDLDSKK